jgi:hypothetical protein
MQGYRKVSLGPSITMHYNGYVDAYMQGYSKGRVGKSIMVYCNG